uniref:CNNM transmembrane domain-containing protein n=1 Tax=Araucaria cunninghamii TaxID=56994 RepID=A0A0D6R7T7_ARACU
MAGGLCQCFIHTIPVRGVGINQTLSRHARKPPFISSSSFAGTQIRYDVFPCTTSKRRVAKMSWVSPTMKHNNLALTCSISFYREKPLKLSEVVPGSSQKYYRVPKISKQALAVLVAMSCAAFMWSGCRPAFALESIPAPTPHQLSVNMKALWRIVWPKVLQVLSVFRDQGLLIVALLGLSAFFSMAETAIMTLWPWKVQELAEKEPEDGVFRLLRQDVTRFLTSILIGTTVVNIAATVLVTEAATALFGEAGIGAATGFMTVVILLLTEITPKSLAVHNATDVARFVVRPVALLSVVLYPVGRVVTALSMGMLKVLGLKNRSEPLVTEDELKLMLRGAELSGAIEEEEQDMIENVLTIKDTHVREVMTPLVDVVAIDAGATLMDFRNLWVMHQYSRVPVFVRRVDNIVGIAYAMDMLDYVEQAELLEKLTVGRIAHKPAYFVPESMSVCNLLREFRIRKVHMAVVLNEYGGTIGIVTLEDVVEEIVGEIFDENDSKEEIQKKTGYVVQRADGVYDVDANTSVEDLAEALEVKIHEGPYHYETVSGFVCEAFGYIPRTGESIDIVLQKVIGENGMDQHEDQREKFQKYKLEILAGNARKVGAIRFEEIHGEEIKDEKVTRVFPHIVKRRWEGRYEMEDNTVRSDQETSLDKEATPIALSENKEMGESMLTMSANRHVIAENVDVDAHAKPQVVDVSESIVIFPGDVNAVENANTHIVQTDDIDVTSTSSASTSNETWNQYEKKAERRKKRRRKQSVEESLDLEREQTIDLEHKESS